MACAGSKAIVRRPKCIAQASCGAKKTRWACGHPIGQVLGNREKTARLGVRGGSIGDSRGSTRPVLPCQGGAAFARTRIGDRIAEFATVVEVVALRRTGRIECVSLQVAVGPRQLAAVPKIHGFRPVLTNRSAATIVRPRGDFSLAFHTLTTMCKVRAIFVRPHAFGPIHGNSIGHNTTASTALVQCIQYRNLFPKRCCEIASRPEPSGFRIANCRNHLSGRRTGSNPRFCNFYKNIEKPSKSPPSNSTLVMGCRWARRPYGGWHIIGPHAYHKSANTSSSSSSPAPVNKLAVIA